MSASESFGIVVLEAWMAGKAVVVNAQCAAFHDLVVDGENGLLVRDHELVEALRLVVSDAALRERLAASGRSSCNKFSWAQICTEFVAACDELTNEI